jgi:hypothetical protein
MSDYFVTFQSFQKINQSVEQLLTDEYASSEIKQSAGNLRQLVQPGFKELEQSAIRLKSLILTCSIELYHAEGVWLSKPRIIEAAKPEVWEQLGEVSGFHFRIALLVRQAKHEAVKQLKENWEQIFERLQKTWFTDQKGQRKKGVGWSEKEGFIAGIRHEFKIFMENNFEQILGDNLKLIYLEINKVNQDILRSLIEILDERQKNEIVEMLNKVIEEINNKLGNPLQDIPSHLRGGREGCFTALETLVNKGWGDISWGEVFKFKEEVFFKLENLVTALLDDRAKLATQALEQAIAFYNDFLERQERYQQETPEQRAAEKAWIDQQRQQLEQVQHGLDAILNPF